MRKLVWVTGVLLIFVLCKCGNSTQNKNDDKNETTNIDGFDADEHGCRTSAGYVWSNLRKECIRTFEIGSTFLAYATKTDSTTAAYIVLNDEKSKAELFMPNFKNAFELNKIENKKTDEEIVIFENDAAKIKIVISGPNCLVVVNKNPLFVQKIDDDNSLYSKMNGIE